MSDKNQKSVTKNTLIKILSSYIGQPEMSDKNQKSVTKNVL